MSEPSARNRAGKGALLPPAVPPLLSTNSFDRPPNPNPTLLHPTQSTLQDFSSIYGAVAPAPLHPLHPPPRGVTDLIAEVQYASSTASNIRQLYLTIEDEGALDLDAGEENELYLVGTVAERDALMLSQLVPASQTSSDTPRVPAPGLRIRNVSSDPRNPAAFVYYQSKPYPIKEPAAGLSEWNDLVQLVGSASVARLEQT